MFLMDVIDAALIEPNVSQSMAIVAVNKEVFGTLHKQGKTAILQTYSNLILLQVNKIIFFCKLHTLGYIEQETN